ncbi:MAG: hypothetical protein AB7R69_01600 [Candidatus Babeliales bacterium]
MKKILMLSLGLLTLAGCNDRRCCKQEVCEERCDTRTTKQQKARVSGPMQKEVGFSEEDYE